MSRRIKKLEYHCDPEFNKHKECSGKVIENEKTSPCECWCHEEKIREQVPRFYMGGFGSGSG